MNYSIPQFSYDSKNRIYKRHPVKVSFPCSKCGHNRPLKQGTLMPDTCPCKEV